MPRRLTRKPDRDCRRLGLFGRSPHCGIARAGLERVEIRMVADIFATRIARRLIIPRGLNARRKRGGDEMAAMLAFANGAL